MTWFFRKDCRVSAADHKEKTSCYAIEQMISIAGCFIYSRKKDANLKTAFFRKDYTYIIKSTQEQRDVLEDKKVFSKENASK